MFDFVELNYSGISSGNSIESSVTVKCAQYNFSKKLCQNVNPSAIFVARLH